MKFHIEILALSVYYSLSSSSVYLFQCLQCTLNNITGFSLIAYVYICHWIFESKFSIRNFMMASSLKKQFALLWGNTFGIFVFVLLVNDIHLKYWITQGGLLASKIRGMYSFSNNILIALRINIQDAPIHCRHFKYVIYRFTLNLVRRTTSTNLLYYYSVNKEVANIKCSLPSPYWFVHRWKRKAKLNFRLNNKRPFSRHSKLRFKNKLRR